MNCLLRFISRTAAGSTEQTDRIVAAPVITIGRATDQVLHIRDRRARLEHARIEPQEDGIYVTSTSVAGVVVNGRSVRNAKLAVGDSIEIGANILRIIEPPTGVDFALSFELSTSASRDDFVADWSASLTSAGRFSKRQLSWMLAAIVLVLALLLPALSLFGPVAAVARSSPLPDDSWWLAGPVHSAHSTISAQCDACHVEVFQRVPDAACTECHEAARHVADTGEPVLGATRCASCHHEHNEPAELVNRDQALCADCHAGTAAGTGLEPAADFLDEHPEFKVSLLLPVVTAGDVEWQTQHLSLPEARGMNNSNLRFDHAAHLDEDGIVTPDGRRVIECGECHVAEPGGAGMRPIVMDEHCSGCHTLAFDADDPDRSVPHGDPAAVVQALVEYYSARLLGADPDDVEQRLRRPGRALSREDRDRAAAEARGQALTVAADLFERRACATCHEVGRAGSDREVPWQVTPVRLTNDFFVHANFSHAAHRTEVTSCDGCHAATVSSAATDVLIPDIDSCRDCHGSPVARRNSAQQLPSTCIVCHSFHFAPKGPHQ